MSKIKRFKVAATFPNHPGYDHLELTLPHQGSTFINAHYQTATNLFDGDCGVGNAHSIILKNVTLQRSTITFF